MFQKTHCLTDGGVYDNLGISKLTKDAKDSDLLLVSDAEGDFDSEFEKSFASFVSRNVQASDLLMTRVSSLQLDDLASQHSSFLSVGIKDVINDARNLTVEQQRAISKIRTDLDKFSLDEAFALITHGYNIAQRGLMSRGIESVLALKQDQLGNLGNQSKNLTKELQKSSTRKWRLFSFQDWISWATAALVLLFACVATEFGQSLYQRYVQDAKSKAASAVADRTVATIANLTSEIAALSAQMARQAGPKLNTIPIQICLGEFASQCPPGAIWLNCGASLSDWVKAQCTSSNIITKISDRPGNKCGYAIFPIICTKYVNQ